MQNLTLIQLPALQPVAVGMMVQVIVVPRQVAVGMGYILVLKATLICGVILIGMTLICVEFQEYVVTMRIIVVWGCCLVLRKQVQRHALL